MDKGFILALVFAVIIGIFALANSEQVVVDFVITRVEISQALVILLSALLGALIVFFIGLIRTIKLKQDIKKLRKKVEDLEEEQNSMISVIEEDDLVFEELDDDIIEELENENE